MLAFLKALVVLPIAVIVVLFAVANRGPVLLSLDPAAKGTPELAVSVPLYGLLLAAVALGMVIGGVATWLAAGRQRRQTRLSRREMHQARAEADRLRSDLAALRPAPGAPAGSGGTTLPARRAA